MTVAATIENLTVVPAQIGASQTGRYSQAMTLDRAGTGHTSAPATDPRSSWQSILAELGIDKKSLSAEPEDAGQEETVAFAAANTSVNTSSKTAVAAASEQEIAMSQSLTANRTLSKVALETGTIPSASGATKSVVINSALSAHASSLGKKSRLEKDAIANTSAQESVAAAQFTAAQAVEDPAIARVNIPSSGDGAESASGDASSDKSGVQVMAAVGMSTRPAASGSSSTAEVSATGAHTQSTDASIAALPEIVSGSSKNVFGQHLESLANADASPASGGSGIIAGESPATQKSTEMQSVVPLHAAKQASSAGNAGGRTPEGSSDARISAARTSGDDSSTLSDASDAANSMARNAKATSANLEQSATGNGEKSGKENTAGMSQLSAVAEAHPHVGTSVQSPSSEAGSATANISPAVQEVISSSRAETGSSSAKLSETTVNESFAALDADTPTWTHTSTRRAEAGFNDPTLGWIGVQAETSGGGVHAVLVPSSTDAAQTLSSHMDGLNAYLAEHHASVGTLTIADPASGGTGYSMNQGAGQNPNQNAGEDGPAGSNHDLSIPVSKETATAIETQEATHSAIAGRGAHISVMA
jgi:hypothetical protein